MAAAGWLEGTMTLVDRATRAGDPRGAAAACRRLLAGVEATRMPPAAVWLRLDGVLHVIWRARGRWLVLRVDGPGPFSYRRIWAGDAAGGVVRERRVDALRGLVAWLRAGDTHGLRAEGGGDG